MKKIILSIVFLIISSIVLILNAQNRIIDSLENLLSQNVKEDTSRVNLLNKTAYELHIVDLSKTLKYAVEAGELAVKLDYKKGKAESLRLIGICYKYKSDFSRALEYFQESLRIYEATKDLKGISNCLNNIGNIQSNHGNYTQALEYFQKSLKIDEKSGDKLSISSRLNNIGNIYLFQANYPKASEYYQKALNIYKEIGDIKGISICLNNIGEIHFNQGNYSQAFEYFQRSLKNAKEIGESSEINCMLYYNSGAVYLKTKNYSKALEYSYKSMKIAKDIELLKYQKEIYKQLSDIYIGIKNYKKAYTNYVKYKELYDYIFNEKNIKEITGLEYQYNYEKEKQAAKLIQQKKDAVNTEEAKRQNFVSKSFIVGFILMALLVLVVFRSFLQKRNANSILGRQKNEIENKNEELHLQNKEIQQLNEELSSSNDQLYSQREELKTTLAKLKETQSQLVQSEKMASIGILTSGIAHEINNPLNFIQGGKFAIERYIKENIENHSSELLPLIEMIDTGIERTTNIVKSLTRFSRTNESDTEKCDIHLIINNSLVILKNKTDHKVEIIKKYTNVSNSVIGNEGRLHQAFLNILTNAIQAIPEKGTISITTTVEMEKLFIEISDTGYGISEENIKKITDPFFTTKDPGKGTGLGLSIAYNIIQEHKGSIEYKSKEGKGTTVTVTFPIYK